MPNFRVDKEGLQKLLLSFDKDKQIPAGALSPTKRGSSYDAMLVQVLLDVCCSFFAPNDPVKKNQLYTLLNESLYKDKVLANNVFLHPIMKHASGWFMDYLRKTCIDMGNPVNTIITSVPVSNFFTTIYPNTYDQNFEEVEVIASGGFGTVCKAVHKIDKITYAVKKIYYYIDHKEEPSKVLSEVHSIATLSHVNVVSYKNCWVQLLNRDDVVEEESSTPSSSYASRQTDLDCSTPRSSIPFGRRRRGKKTSLLQQVLSNASSDDLSSSSQQLTPCWNRPAKKGFFTPTITEESSESSSESLEDAGDCIDQLDGLTTLSFPDDSQSDSFVQFDYGNQSSASTVLSEEGEEETPGSALVTRSCSTGTPYRERLKAMLCIQMEYCDFDLNRWLEDRAAGKELPFKKDVKDILRDIVRGVDHIHSNSIIHRDLKPSNIFYSKRDGSMKIGDFGLATLSHSVANQPRAVGLQPHTSNLGTFPYMAPEQKQRRDYDEKVDIYSLGIILLELLVPFKTRSEFHDILTSAQSRGELPSELTDRYPLYVDLLTNLLQTDPARRMSAKEILQHPLLQDTAEVEKRQLLLEIQSLKMTLERRERELEAARKEIEDLRAQVQQLNSS